MQMTAPLAQASTADRKVMTDMVRQEIYRQQHSRRVAQTAAAEEARQVRARRDKLLARDLKLKRASAARRPCLLRRISERIVTAYALIVATTVIWGEMLGLWEIVDDDE